MKTIIGKTITAMEISDDREALRFLLTDGECVAYTDAGSRSCTWIEHIELPALGFPAVVVSVDDLSMPEGAPSSFHTGANSLTFYGCKIVTDKGEIIIDYRNDSNGYYCGDLLWPGEYNHDDMYGIPGKNKSTRKWQPIGKLETAALTTTGETK